MASDSGSSSPLVRRPQNPCSRSPAPLASHIAPRSPAYRPQIVPRASLLQACLASVPCTRPPTQPHSHARARCRRGATAEGRHLFAPTLTLTPGGRLVALAVALPVACPIASAFAFGQGGRGGRGGRGGQGVAAKVAVTLATLAGAIDWLLYRQRSGLYGRGGYDGIGRHVPEVEQPEPSHPPSLPAGRPQPLPQP